MWPWEHLAVGYVVYSLLRRLWTGRPPADGAALAVAVGTQLPDLVDKPLAWGLGVLPSGLSAGHSVFVAVPTAVLAWGLSRRAGRPDVGVALGVGHLSHLAGDVLYPVLLGGQFGLGAILWPLVPRPPDQGELLGRVAELFADFLAFLATPRGQVYLAGEVALLSAALALWLYDGAPGLPWPRRRRRRPAEG